MLCTAPLVILAGQVSFVQGFPGYLPSSYTTARTSSQKLHARQDDIDHTWQFRGPDGQGQRAPCPGLNTLANHGYLNRDGRNITALQIQQAFLDAFNTAFDVTKFAATNAMNACNLVTGRTNCTSIDLPMLDVPHQFEHDGSVSRGDFDMPWNHHNNNFAFNMTIWEETLGIYGGSSHIGIPQASSAHLGRRATQMAQDTPGWFSDAGAPASFAEFAFTLTSMNDPAVNPGQDINAVQARLDWISYWFQNERLPTELGWVKPTQVISQSYVGAIASRVSAGPTAPPASGTFYARPSAPATADKRDLGSPAATVTATATVNHRALASLLADPTQSAGAHMRLARASAQAGPAPTGYNPYTEVVSVERMAKQRDAFDNYSVKMSAALFDHFGDEIL